jgi:predicted solute-binding protein
VDPYTRTPVAVLRIVLDSLFNTLPDICVARDALESWEREKWRERFDAVLLTGDRGLRHFYRRASTELTLYNLSEMWYSLTFQPLVLAVWAYNGKNLEGALKKALIASRNLGVRNLSLISDGIAQTSEYAGEFLYEHYGRSWSYEMGAVEIEGLKALEDYAFQYRLIRSKRSKEGVLLSGA